MKPSAPPIGFPVAYTVPPGHWLAYGSAGAVLAGLITGARDDGTVDLVVFPRMRPAEHIDNVEIGTGLGQCRMPEVPEMPEQREEPEAGPVAGAEHPAALVPTGDDTLTGGGATETG